jgi:hypothetical protein
LRHRKNLSLSTALLQAFLNTLKTGLWFLHKKFNLRIHILTFIFVKGAQSYLCSPRYQLIYPTLCNWYVK